MMAPHSKVTICRMARHAGLFILVVRSSRLQCGELTDSVALNDAFRGACIVLWLPQTASWLS
jgi:hypothetical protein